MKIQQKKFVLITKSYLPARGGIEIIVRQSARLLKKFGNPEIVTLLFDNAHKIDFCSMYPFCPSGKPYFDEDGTKVIPLSPSAFERLLLLPIGLLDIAALANSFNGRLRLLFYFFFRLAYQHRFRSLCASATCIYSFEGNFLGKLGFQTAKQMKVPFLISPFVHPCAWGDDFMNISLYRKADMVLTLSEYEKLWFQSKGVSHLKLTATGNYPIERPRFSLKKHFGIDGTIVLFLGRKEKYKGYQLLLDAWDCIREKAQQAWVVLIGPGFIRKIDPVARLCTDRATDFYPYDFDIFCMPSKSETFGLVYIEAWEIGKPIIAQRIKAVEEMMHGQKAGLLLNNPDDATELAQKLLFLIQNPDVCKKMGECGRKIQQKYYSQERFEQNLLNAFKMVSCI